MAAERDKERETEQFFLDENGDDGIEVNKIFDGGGGGGSSISGSDIENVEGGGGDDQGSPSDVFASQQWPRSYRFVYFR